MGQCAGGPQEDESQEATHHPGPPPQEIQVRGAVQQTHQGLPQSGLPSGAPPLQHLGRRRQPGPDVRPGGGGHPLRLGAQQVRSRVSE